VSYIVNLI